MLTLDDLKPRVIDVAIVRGQLPPTEPDGAPVDDTVVVPLRIPSWVEWNELGMEIPVPEAEMVRVMKNGKPTFEKESGESFEAKKILANNQRTLRRLTFALIKAGNFPELKNAAVDEQMAAVGTLDSGMLNALARVLNSTVQMTMGRLTDKAERFRDKHVPAMGNGSVFTESLDAGDVEKASG